MTNRDDTPRAGNARRNVVLAGASDAAFAQSDRRLAATPAPAAHGTVELERRGSVLRWRLGASMRAVASAIMLATGTAQGASAQSLVTHRIPAALAMEAVTAAVAACANGVTATVIDADAARIAVLRGDIAGVHTFEASWSKAYTALDFAPILKLGSSGEVARFMAQFSARQPPGTLPFTPPEHMIFRPGGVTIRLGEEVIGAIGVQGAPTLEADEVCAHAGLDKIKERIR
jgi:uncharacterized protein GlcG (DUF336 family)